MTHQTWLKLSDLNVLSSTRASSWTYLALQEHNKALKELNVFPASTVGAGIDESERMRTELVNLRRIQVKEVVRKMKAARRLDLCFLVDATGSMKPHIMEVKDAILRIVDKLSSKPTVGTQSIVNMVCSL